MADMLGAQKRLPARDSGRWHHCHSAHSRGWRGQARAQGKQRGFVLLLTATSPATSSAAVWFSDAGLGPGMVPGRRPAATG
jgi:hypothetical protein